jgi:hypothetical protein
MHQDLSGPAQRYGLRNQNDLVEKQLDERRPPGFARSAAFDGYAGRSTPARRCFAPSPALEGARPPDSSRPGAPQLLPTPRVPPPARS